jgi:hypothetical protein
VANSKEQGLAARTLVKRAALYARASTESHERQETVASQLEALRRAAAERQLHVPADLVLTDDGQSGARLDRPGLARLRDLAAKRALRAVLVCAPDRLAQHYEDQVLVLEELERCGCEVVFLNPAVAETTPGRPTLFQLRNVLAEMERARVDLQTPAPTASTVLAEASPMAKAAAEAQSDKSPAIEMMSLRRPPGTMIGPYQLIRLIGEGGMGHVYRAHETVLERDVAVKLISRQPCMKTRKPCSASWPKPS